MDDIQAGAGIAPDSVDDVPTSDGGQVLADCVQVPTPFIAIATPSIDAHCTMAHRSSMLELRGLLVHKGIPHAIFDRSRMLYLDRVRDYLATQFLEDFPDATDLFLIDADVGFPAEKVIEFAIRPEPLLLGAPPKKEDKAEGPSFTVRFLADDSSGQPRLIQNNGLVKIDRGPAGFIRIKRSVLQTMIEADKCVRYREPETGRMLWHFFSAGVGPDPDSDVPGQLTYWGEDTVFIQRAINCGIECWCDPNIHFAHTGLKTWQGNLYRELLRQHGKMVEPEGLAPSHVGASSPVPAHNEAAMDDYPKWVHGKVAASAEEESALERDWQEANPGAIAAMPAPVDEGIAPIGVSASTPIVPDDQKSTAQLEAEIEASLEHAAELTVLAAAPADEPVKEDSPQPVEAANLLAEPVEEDPPVPVAGLEAPPAGENQPTEPAQPAIVDQTAEVDTGANLAETLLEQPQTAEPVAAVDTAPADLEVAAQQGAANRDTNSPELNPAADQSVNTPAELVAAIGAEAVEELGAEAPAIAAVESGNSDSANAEFAAPAAEDSGMPAGELAAEAAETAAEGTTAPAAEPAAAALATVAPASESPGSGEPSPAADQVEAEAPADQVQAAAAAGPVDAPEPVSATAPAAEVEQPAPDAPLAAAEVSPASDQPLEQPPGPLSVDQEETAAAGDGAQPAPVAAEAPAEATAAAAVAASPGAAGTVGATAEPDASSAAAEAQPVEDEAPAQVVEPSETAAQSDGAAPADQAPEAGSGSTAPADQAPAADAAHAADAGEPSQPATADAAIPAADAEPLPDSAAPAQGGAA